jgi:DNA repair protein RadC
MPEAPVRPRPRRTGIPGVVGVPFYRCQLERLRSTAEMPETIGTPVLAAAAARKVMPPTADRIHVLGIALDLRLRPIGAFLVGVGTLTHALIAPADCLKPVLLLNGSGFVLAMNHVSGVPGPVSVETRAAVSAVAVAAGALGLCLHDFIILGDDSHVSFKDAGLLTSPDQQLHTAC